jgi:hypothetical protein
MALLGLDNAANKFWQIGKERFYEKLSTNNKTIIDTYIYPEFGACSGL